MEGAADAYHKLVYCFNLLLFFFVSLHFCETKPIVAKFYNREFRGSTLTNMSHFMITFFLMQHPVTLIQSPLTLFYIKQQFEKNTSKIKHQAQRPREHQMLLVVSL